MDFHQTWLCIGIVEIWFGIAVMGKFHQMLMELSTRDTPKFSFPDDIKGDTLNFSFPDSVKGFKSNLVQALILRRSGLGLLPRHDNGGVLYFYIFI